MPQEHRDTRVPKRRSTNKAKGPAWFNQRADATNYIISEERPYVMMNGKQGSDIKEVFQITPEEFVEVKRLIGNLRGFGGSNAP